MYVAVKAIKVMVGKKVVRLKPGDPVPQALDWGERVLRAHLKLNHIKLAAEEGLRAKALKERTAHKAKAAADVDKASKKAEADKAKAKAESEKKAEADKAGAEKKVADASASEPKPKKKKKAAKKKKA